MRSKANVFAFGFASSYSWLISFHNLFPCDGIKPLFSLRIAFNEGLIDETLQLGKECTLFLLLNEKSDVLRFRFHAIHSIWL